VDDVGCELSLEARDGLLDHVKRIGEQIRDEIAALGHPAIREVRGAGLLLGIVLTEPIAVALNEALLQAGFLANAPQADVIRIAPPLILSANQADAFVAALSNALTHDHPNEDEPITEGDSHAALPA